MNKADFKITHVTEDRVFVVDLNLGNMSVTNDAERVYKEVRQRHPNKRVIYKDSMGNWDEIRLNSRGSALFLAYAGY